MRFTQFNEGRPVLAVAWPEAEVSHYAELGGGKLP